MDSMEEDGRRKREKERGREEDVDNTRWVCQQVLKFVDQAEVIHIDNLPV